MDIDIFDTKGYILHVYDYDYLDQEGTGITSNNSAVKDNPMGLLPDT